MNRLKFFFPVLLLLSCLRTPEAEIDLNRNDNVSVFDLFSGVKIVPLEVGPESMISDIMKVIYYKGHYYLSNNNRSAVYCFDEDGKYVFKIDSRGKGMGEYLYISDFTIDQERNQILLLDPIIQRIFYFDINGKFIVALPLQSETNLGLKQVFVVNDDVLLLTGRHHAFVFYSLKENSFFQSEYPFSSSLPYSLFARNHIYQFNGRTFALPPLKQQIMDFTDYNPVSYFNFDFGRYNNQENRILDMIKQSNDWSDDVLSGSQVTGKGKHLHHYFMMVNETTRFRLALIEFNDVFKNIVFDKKLGKTYVFDNFQEGTILPWNNIIGDRAICMPDYPISKRDSVLLVEVGLKDFFFGRNRKTFCSEMLNQEDKEIVENHNPLTENPYLVVYKFLE